MTGKMPIANRGLFAVRRSNLGDMVGRENLLLACGPVAPVSSLVLCTLQF